MTSHNIDLSSWDILYIPYQLEYCKAVFLCKHCFLEKMHRLISESLAINMKNLLLLISTAFASFVNFLFRFFYRKNWGSPYILTYTVHDNVIHTTESFERKARRFMLHVEV
jgi:hypothetical protein